MATFGNGDAGSTNTFTPQANNKIVSKFTCHRSGNLQQIQLFGLSTGGAGTKFKAIVYSDSGGSPANLLAESTERQVGVDAAPHIFQFPGGLALSAGTDYWLGIHSNASNTALCAVVVGAAKSNADTYSDGATATFGAATTSDRRLPMIALFDPQLAAGSYLGDPVGSIFSNSGVYTANRTHAFPITPSVSGTISSIVYYARTAVTGQIRGCIYDATGANYPRNVLGVTNTLAASAANENTLTFASPVSVNAGQLYFIGLQTDTNVFCWISPEDAGLYPTAYNVADPWVGSSPGNPYPTGSPITFHKTVSLWAEFTPAGGGGGGGASGNAAVIFLL